jgi:dipeptidase D
MNLKPEKVFYYFAELSKIPRASGNTKAVSDYCVDFAKAHGFAVRQDEWNNVVIRREATKGREKEPGIIVQGHLDMVAEKYPDSLHDFEKDPIELVKEGDFLTAKDTTLGADDGIAVAMGLALLDDDELSHPQLEVIFTTDEETGMDGARNIDLSDITGTYVLNLDSEDEGILTAGCAGGAKTKTRIPVARAAENGTLGRICISGLKGGHSGVEIDKERANADILMGRLLSFLHQQERVALVDLQGGGKDNAIPREAVCSILLPEEDSDKEERKEHLTQNIRSFEQMILQEYAAADGDITINFTVEEEKGEYAVLEDSSFQKLLFYLCNVPNGVMFHSQDIPGLVETSCNLGIMKLEHSAFVAVSSVRSSVASRKQLLLDKLTDMAENAGGALTVSGAYPAWAYKRESLLRDTLLETYRELYQEELKVDVIHAGLECGYLLEKNPSLDIVSFGPQMYDIHTTEERLSIPSTEKIYRFVTTVIEKGIS